MIIIGITGSIGTGKTTVSKMLQILNIPVFDSDKKVKEILDKNHLVINKISKIWPEVISTNEMQRKINKVVLGNKIFENKPKMIILTTKIYENQNKDWDYFEFQTGQHIFFYTKDAFKYLAKKFNYGLVFLDTLQINKKF